MHTLSNFTLHWNIFTCINDDTSKYSNEMSKFKKEKMKNYYGLNMCKTCDGNFFFFLFHIFSLAKFQLQ